MTTYFTDDGKRVTPDTSEVPGFPKPWCVVDAAGTDDEYVIGECSTFGEALRLKRHATEGADVMKRRADGSLTTEY